MRAMLLVGLIGMLIGCSRQPSTSPDSERKSNPESPGLFTEPINKREAEKALLGRSTREVNERLGPPSEVLRDHQLGWVYHSSSGKTIILVIDNDRVTEIDWGGALQQPPKTKN